MLSLLKAFKAKSAVGRRQHFSFFQDSSYLISEFVQESEIVDNCMTGSIETYHVDNLKGIIMTKIDYRKFNPASSFLAHDYLRKAANPANFALA